MACLRPRLGLEGLQGHTAVDDVRLLLNADGTLEEAPEVGVDPAKELELRVMVLALTHPRLPADVVHAVPTRVGGVYLRANVFEKDAKKGSK